MIGKIKQATGHLLGFIDNFGLSILWLLVTLGTSLSLIVAKTSPDFFHNFQFSIKLCIIGLSFLIYFMLFLFYFDAWADTREGNARHDVTVERFVWVGGTLTLVIGTSMDLISRLDQPPSWRIPIYLFGYLMLLYGIIKRRRHYTKLLFQPQPERDLFHPQRELDVEVRPKPGK